MGLLGKHIILLKWGVVVPRGNCLTNEGSRPIGGNCPEG